MDTRGKMATGFWLTNQKETKKVSILDMLPLQK